MVARHYDRLKIITLVIGWFVCIDVYVLGVWVVLLLLLVWVVLFGLIGFGMFGLFGWLLYWLY